MSRYIAFLRGINVGGHQVKMGDLRGMFEGLGRAVQPDGPGAGARPRAVLAHPGRADRLDPRRSRPREGAGGGADHGPQPQHRPSPGGEVPARSRSTYLRTLPLALSGRASTTSTERGTL